ncbi:hypothetical protein [Nocardiopsis halotolerans]|uniref:hypothetical protein n=1 Tax=Nocardiopsis halotolerans TaxID=124252 RepID=UPI000349DF5E|nr:hypothetical protein [Nocardiopsis halotolerans]
MRPAAATAVLTLVAAGAAIPAHADEGSFLRQVECGSSGGAGCSILLRWAQTQGGRSGSGGSDDSGDSDGSGGSGGSTGDVDWSAIDWDAIDWSQVDWDAIDWESIDYEGEDEGETPTDPVTLIQESMDSFELPRPTIGTSPGSDSLILVNTPVWLWLESQEWEAAEASAEVPGWSLTVTATPTFTVWDLGDGTRVRCEGPGTPFDPAVHDPAEASPDCGHVYTLPSDTQPDGTHTVTVEVGWDVGWELSDGEAGDEAGELDPVTTTSRVELQVVESQGLVTDTDPR